jgi:hypothetical protein
VGLADGGAIHDEAFDMSLDGGSNGDSWITASKDDGSQLECDDLINNLCGGQQHAGIWSVNHFSKVLKCYDRTIIWCFYIYIQSPSRGKQLTHPTAPGPDPWDCLQAT